MKIIVKLTSILISVLMLIGCMTISSRQSLPPDTSLSPNFMSQSIKKIVVLVQAGNNVPQRRIEDEFISSLLQKNYQVVSRSDLERLMEEMSFQHSHITDNDAVRIGKMLNVPAVLIVAVTDSQTKRRETYTIIQATLGARLIGVETGEILWIGTHKKSELDHHTYNSILAMAAKELSQSFPSR